MTLPFSDRADFSGMNGGKEPLRISAVIHKAYVDVNEAGTEAAAASAVGMRALAVRVPTPPVPFRADHPFLFLIRDRRTGNLLFLGSLTQPSS
jgi:serpin B